MSRATIVIGGQYGEEENSAVVEHLRKAHDYTVRAAGEQAEHNEARRVMSNGGSVLVIGKSNDNATMAMALCALPIRFQPGDLAIVMVVSTYPMRRIDHPGLMNNERSWEIVGQRTGQSFPNNSYRVGEWDEELVDTQIVLSKPTAAYITGAQYIARCAGQTDWQGLPGIVKDFVQYVESRFAVPVHGVATGPQTLCLSPARVKRGKI